MATIHPEVTTSTHPATLVEDDLVTTTTGRRWLAVTRLATGFVFLWAFLDKTFGLHYSTGAAVAEGDPSLLVDQRRHPEPGLHAVRRGRSVQGRVRLDGEPGHRLALHALPARCRRRRHAGHRPAGLGGRRLAPDGLDVDRRVAAAAGLDQPGDGLPPDLRAGPGRLRDAPRRRHLGPRSAVGAAPRSCSGTPGCADVAGLAHESGTSDLEVPLSCRRTTHGATRARVSPTQCRSVTICRMVDNDAGWTESTVEVEGHDVFYRESGDVPGAVPIVHVHGFAISGAYLMPTARELAVARHQPGT